MIAVGLQHYLQGLSIIESRPSQNHILHLAALLACHSSSSRQLIVQVKKVREYMKDSKFTVDDIRSISTAGAGLLKWVFAMVNYYR